MNKKVKLYIATHKAVEFPIDTTYVPIHVGAKLTKKIISNSIKDDTEDNISHKNKNYCELTALYWIWKNDNDSDYVGLVHYRRYFFDKYYKFKINQVLTKNDILDIITDNTIIVPKKLFSKFTVKDAYSILHKEKDIFLVRKIIEENCPEYLDAFNLVMSNMYFHPFNMFIMSNENLKNYSKWLFSILFKLEDEISLETYDQYNQRVYGFLSERLFNIWILKNNFVVKEMYVKNLEQNKFKEQVTFPIKNLLLKLNAKIKDK